MSKRNPSPRLVLFSSNPRALNASSFSSIVDGEIANDVSDNSPPSTIGLTSTGLAWTAAPIWPSSVSLPQDPSANAPHANINTVIERFNTISLDSDLSIAFTRLYSTLSFVTASLEARFRPQRRINNLRAFSGLLYLYI
jgi:hypothetical protein